VPKHTRNFTIQARYQL